MLKGHLDAGILNQTSRRSTKVQPLTSQEAKALEAMFAPLSGFGVTLESGTCAFSSDNKKVTFTANRNETTIQPIENRTTVVTSTGLTSFTMEKQGKGWKIVKVVR